MNKSNSILLIDPSFDPASSINCDLLLKVGMDSFSYAILNKETNQVVAVYDEQECEDGAKKLSERLKTDHYLQLSYRQVKSAVCTLTHISIPDAFFGTVDLTTHTQYFAHPHSKRVYTKSQPFFQYTSVFALSEKTEQDLASLNSKNYQEYTTLLQLAQHTEGNALWLDFSANSVAMVYTKDNQLVFQQTFEISGPEELNYYLLLLISQLEINSEETQVKVSGIINENDEKFMCLQKYFVKNDFITVQTGLGHEILEDLPLHYFTTLIALDECE